MSGIKKVVIVGAGFMGSGIAQTSAQNNFQTTVVDLDEKALQRSRKYIEESLSRLKNKHTPQQHEKFVKHVFANLTFSTILKDAVSDADLVIEAIVENLKAKQELLKNLEQLCPKKTLFATNTSTLLVKNIGSLMNDPSRFGGLHYFFPVPKVEIVEVVKGEKTSDSTFQKLCFYCREIKKIPIRCKDTPGFIVNSILMPQQNAALDLIEKKLGTIEEIDLACEKALGLPLGPFRLLDYIGLDTAKAIREGLIEHYPELNVKSSPILNSLVSQGKFGQKSGEGFYKYKSKL